MGSLMVVCALSLRLAAIIMNNANPSLFIVFEWLVADRLECSGKETQGWDAAQIFSIRFGK
jgi:hypothetical protein